jgi:hypothetical protein
MQQYLAAAVERLKVDELRLRLDQADGPTKPRRAELDRRFRDANRAMWRAMQKVLAAYAHPDNHPAGQVPIEAFPAEIAGRLALVVEDLVGGHRPETTELLATAHRPRGGVDLRVCRRDAVRYIEAAERGLISDSDPLATVEREFGIRRRTTLDWRAKAQGIVDNSAAAARDAEFIEAAMKKSAARYRWLGFATAGRAENRRPKRKNQSKRRRDPRS